MADDAENDDRWLYGDQHEESQEELSELPETNGVTTQEPQEPIEEELEEESTDDKPTAEEETTDNDKSKEKDEEEGSEKQTQQNGEEEDMDDDDSDDDVNVVIGDIKSTPSYTSLNIKRGALLTSNAPGDKTKQSQQTGKFTMEEFDQVGMINGVPATEYNLDSLEDKPWRKPGADITDYFNYGFNEDTWRAYCERQKRMRMTESGVGLAAQMRGSVPIMNDNSKYSGNFLGMRKAGPPPGRRMTGAIDVIGCTPAAGSALGKGDQQKMNVIQVMTADRREYSRKPAGFPDMSVPPPSNFEDFQPEYGFNPDPEPFYGGYEPTQDSQWGAEGPPALMGPPMSLQVTPPSPRREGSPRRESPERERVRETSRSRSERPRDRERSHRRERSRSRSRRHRSRSRSPSHRSHRKKKSRRHEDSD